VAPETFGLIYQHFHICGVMWVIFHFIPLVAKSCKRNCSINTLTLGLCPLAWGFFRENRLTEWKSSRQRFLAQKYGNSGDRGITSLNLWNILHSREYRPYALR
jgi:hypothetical protein